MAVPGWVWVVLLVTAITITIRFLIMKSRETGGTSQPMLTTDQIIKQTGFDELGATTTTSSTDASGAITTTTTDSTGKTMSVTTSKDGSTTQTTVKDKDGTVLADNKSSALDVIKTVAPTLLANIAAGVARDLVIIGGAKIISKASKEVAEKGVKSALQQGGKMVSRQGPELAMKFLGYVTKNSADKAAQAAAETGLRKAAKEAADKVAAAELKRLGKKAVSEITDKAAKEALEKAMEKAGKEAAEKAATEAAQKVASKAATTAAEKATAKLAGAAAAKIGAKAGMAAAKMGAKAGMGPVGVALMAFDVLSMALDIAGCGGFQEGPFDNKTWIKTRDTFNGQVKAMVDDANESGIDPVRWPIITGPFDKLDAVTLQTRLMDKIRAAMSDPENKYVKDVVAKLKTAVEAKTITDESQVDTFIDENIDLEGLLMDSTKAICTDLKGKLIMDGENFAGCSWPDQAQCEASFKWPILEGNDTDIYSVWNKEKQECNKDPVSQNMHGICEGEGFPYNKETKICELSKEHCLKKGMNWDGTNCKLNKGQEIAEMMFGTTVVRGLNALFSEDQYKPCPPGTKTPNELAIVGGLYMTKAYCSSDKCPDGQDRVSGLCYDQCKTGYDDKSDGITGMKVQGMCYKCPDGFKKTTTGMCQRVSCPSGQEQGTGLGAGFCYKKCSDLHGGEYTESDGASICKKPCPAGMVQEALTCRRNAETKTSASAQKTCPAGWSQSVAGPGGMCQQDCTDGYKKYGGLCYHPDVDTSKLSRIPNKSGCDSGQRDDGTSCWEDHRKTGTRGHRGWIAVYGGCGCIKKTLMQRQSCPAGYSGPTGGFCYAVSKPVPQSKSITEVGQCNDTSKPEGAGGMCYEPCSNFGGSFKRSAVGLCQMDVMVTERTKTRAPEGPFVVAKPADQYSREPLGISYKVTPRPRAVPFGKGPNGC